MTEQRIVQATQTINAAAADIFELIADPARQPEWDGNDNLAEAPEGQRITDVDQEFTMHLTNGQSRTNYVVEFSEGRLIAWNPAPTGETPRGHLFRWELRPLSDTATEVTHTYDWTQLVDETRFERARSYTKEALLNSVNRLSLRVEH
ncbi:SRPBCC family protein [Yaniella halotolerans]|uniref:SRPBCC family protein n=1 Tax=Yaniella halotolerans TaxID=225453 RepID=UPI0004985AD7|nr:SRPBCC family protein [Yaniella halotolerans]